MNRKVHCQIIALFVLDSDSILSRRGNLHVVGARGNKHAEDALGYIR